MNKSNHLVFLDLETGGLNGLNEDGHLGCQYYPILEFGIVITKPDLKRVGEPLRIVVHHGEEQLERLHSKALEMHTKSGLLDEVRASNINLEQAEEMILEYLSKNGVVKYDSKLKIGGILSGSSVHFDRSFIMAQCPGLNNYLHYRQIDISSLALAYRMWRPVVELAGCANKTYPHLALEDICETISEAKIYKTFMQQLQ